MRRLTSGLVLLVVAAVVLVAGIDAIRQAVAPEPAQAKPKPRPIDGLTLLSGRLVWIDERCRLHTTSVSTLQQRERTRRVSCRSQLSASGTLTRRSAAGRSTYSPSGRLLARATGSEVVVSKGGRLIRLPLARVGALAWSPDERWLAAAGRNEVYLIRLLNRDMRIRRLPIVATDLAWVS